MKYLSQILLLSALCILFVSCDPNSGVNEYDIPEVCYDDASLIWSIDGTRQLATEDLQAMEPEKWQDWFDIAIDGSWKFSLSSEDYSLDMAARSIFDENELKELDEEEWSEVLLLRGVYSLKETPLLRHSLTQKAGGEVMGDQVGEASGQVQFFLERNDVNCHYLILQVTAIFQERSSQEAHQMELSVKIPYSY